MHIQLFFSAIILGLLFNDVVYAQNGIVCKDKESKFVACKNDEVDNIFFYSDHLKKLHHCRIV